MTATLLDLEYIPVGTIVVVMTSPGIYKAEVRDVVVSLKSKLPVITYIVAYSDNGSLETITESPTYPKLIPLTDMEMDTLINWLGDE